MLVYLRSMWCQHPQSASTFQHSMDCPARFSPTRNSAESPLANGLSQQKQSLHVRELHRPGGTCACCVHGSRCSTVVGFPMQVPGPAIDMPPTREHPTSENAASWVETKLSCDPPCHNTAVHVFSKISESDQSWNPIGQNFAKEPQH